MCSTWRGYASWLPFAWAFSKRHQRSRSKSPSTTQAPPRSAVLRRDSACFCVTVLLFVENAAAEGGSHACAAHRQSTKELA